MSEKVRGNKSHRLGSDKWLSKGNSWRNKAIFSADFADVSIALTYAKLIPPSGMSFPSFFESFSYLIFNNNPIKLQPSHSFF